MYQRPATLELTDDPEANALIASDMTAFVIGWILDQQVKVQQAFAAPLKLRERIGTLEPAAIANMEVQDLINAFVEKPVLHRYGGTMAKRVHACMKVIVSDYGGDPEQIWLSAADYGDLRKRLLELPGFGATKAPAVAAMLARRFGLDITGFEDQLFPYGSLSEVERYEDLLAYQERKRLWKAEQS